MRPMGAPDEQAAKANSIHLPPELVSLIDEIMAIRPGYSSRAEFVREVVREKCFSVIENSKPRKKGRWP